MSIEIATTLHARDHQNSGPASIADIATTVGSWAVLAQPEAAVEDGVWSGVGASGRGTFTVDTVDLGAGDRWGWVAIFEQPDARDPTVTWRVEVHALEDPAQAETEIKVVLLRRSSDRRVRLIRTDHPEPPRVIRPEWREPPRVIRDLLDAPLIACVDGDVPLSAESRMLTREDIPYLKKMLVSPERRLPVIGISLPPHGDAPMVDPDGVAGSLAGMAHVWVIPADLAWALSRALPERLSVFNGAVRIWWPGIMESGSSPYDHHLFMLGRTGAHASLVALVRSGAIDRFEAPAGLDFVRREAWRRKEDALLNDLIAGLPATDEPATQSAIDEMADQLRDAREERNEWFAFAEAEGERRSAADGKVVLLQEKVVRLEALVTERAAPGATSVEGAASDPVEAFISAVQQAWRRQICTSRSDRQSYPLLPFRLHENFLKAVDDLEGVTYDKIVRVCAEVACDRARDLDSRQVHPLRKDAGHPDQRERMSDGAKAWRCALQQVTSSARRLHWWHIPRPAGEQDIIEFAHVGVHDDESCPS